MSKSARGFILAATLAFAPGFAGAQAAASSIAIGGRHACAVTAEGTLKCWGKNLYGQLGDGTDIDRYSAVDVVGLAGVARVAVGESHTCALTHGGGVKCWGWNYYGQLGSGVASSLAPVDVAGLSSGVVAIAAVDNFSCAVASGAVKCWGDTPLGPYINPTDVPGLAAGAASVSVALGPFGKGYGCAVMVSGGAKCWGYGYPGVLGDGSYNEMRLAAVDVTGLASGVAAVSTAEGHACALTIGGAVKCWGDAGGILGDGTPYQSSVPVAVAGLGAGVASIATGGAQSCARMVTGALKCWGKNYSGALGDGTIVDRLAPVDVAGLSSGVASVAIGAYGSFACAVLARGTLKCWGSNGMGLMAMGIDPSRMERLAPIDPIGLQSGIAAVSSRRDHTCVLTAAGGVKCFGKNDSGQIGDGSRDNNRPVPTDVSGLSSGMAKLAAGDFHTCGVTSAGAARCWGGNRYGQLGDGTTTDRSVPVTVSTLSSGVSKVISGGLFSCALVTGGGVKCWGLSSFLGNGSSTNATTPVHVTGLTSGVVDIGAGGDHACAITATGAVKCWGYNGSSQLGNGTTTASLTPVDVSGLPAPVTTVIGGTNHTCVRTSAGAAYCWGRNLSGQLGDGTTTARRAPTPVSGLSSGVAGLAAGQFHTCAVMGSGAVKCWGLNSDGSLGDGTRSSRLTPVDVLGISNAIDVAAGWSHTCAVTGTGATKCWGSASEGQLGDGLAKYYTTPMDVPGFAPRAPLSASPAAISFGGQSMNTTAPAMVVTITNPSGSAITVTSVTATAHFGVTGNNCTTLANGGTCTASVGFTPATQGALNGTLTLTTNLGVFAVPLTGAGERSLVTHYYRSILRRAPDAGGKTFWDAEAARVQALGVNVNEVWFALAGSFYGSAEYAAQGRDNAGYVTDMYNTFFNRAPDAAGLTYWAGLLASGMSREVVLASFMFSSEFATFTQGIFGAASTRKEVDTVVDFYRGILGRLPDDGGFGYWLQLFRQAQCQGAGAVSAQAESISSQYANSPEYGARNRSNSQFVGDMYNAFLRRGGDLAGVQYWIGQLDSGARSRENVRQNFVASSEFSARVAAVIAQGCLP